MGQNDEIERKGFVYVCGGTAQTAITYDRLMREF